jgi:hypothetical protein
MEWINSAKGRRSNHPLDQNFENQIFVLPQTDLALLVSGREYPVAVQRHQSHQLLAPTTTRCLNPPKTHSTSKEGRQSVAGKAKHVVKGKKVAK